MLIPLLALFLAGPVTVYVGPQSRDGFVDADKGVNDSVADIREALAGAKGIQLVEREEGADLKLYVIGRNTTIKNTGTSTGTVVGGTVMMSSGAYKSRQLDAVLRAGTYERAFSVDSNFSWSKAAGKLAKDVSTWLEANRAQITASK